VNFEWDEKKAAQNIRKHGVSFHEAATVFADALAATYPDPDHSLAEQRYITIGVSQTGRALVVAFTERGNNIRIISARKATRAERKFYEEGN
jgi:uncharacterized DUF497 family protein